MGKCLCGETANESGLCEVCEGVRESLRPDPECPYCEIAQRMGTVISCQCISVRIEGTS